MSCNPCCCSDCSDEPSQLIVTIKASEGAGQVIAARSFDGIIYNEAVYTDCTPPPHKVGLASIRTVSSGNGYTEAPTITLSGGGDSVGAVYWIRVPVDKRGSGYTDPPAVIIEPPGPGLTAASAVATLQGSTVQSVTVESGGSLYTKVPTVTLQSKSGSGAEAYALAALPAVVAAEVVSPIRSILITDGGTGYSSKPLVTIKAEYGGEIRAAKGTSVIEGPIASLTLLDHGSYSSAPTVTIRGGEGAEAIATVGNGYVQSVEIEDGGSGYSSPPQVSIDGSAAGVSYINQGAVSFVLVTDKGSGYQYGTPPEVTFSGGGGSGAKAAAVMKYEVTSLSLTKGGSGYPENPIVSFSGDGSGATATAKINGSVVEVVLSDAGSYRNLTKSSDPEYRLEWPTISFSTGSAKAKLGFCGGVEFSLLYSGGGYTEEPNISLSGGGGIGAAALPVLAWQQEQTRVIDISSCYAADDEIYCTSTNSKKYPDAPCVGCGGQAASSPLEPPPHQRYGEEIWWLVRARTSATEGRPSEQDPYEATDARDIDYLFDGEALYVYWKFLWDAVKVGFPIVQTKEYIRLKRLYSRVQPNGKVSASRVGDYPIDGLAGGAVAVSHSMPTLGLSLPEVSAPVATIGDLGMYEDLKGDIVWRPRHIVLEHGGENLRIIKGEQTVYWNVHSGNLVQSYPGIGMSSEFTAEYSSPTVGSVSIAGVEFTTAPEFSFAFSPAQDVGDYTLASASVLNGGQTSTTFGVFAGYLTLAGGFVPPNYATTVLSIVVSGGTVTSVSIAAGGLFRGPAKLTSATLPPDDFTDLGRSFIGKSTYQTIAVRSEPSVTASAGGTAELAVVLEEHEDENGKAYWAVAEVNVIDGGSGYEEDQPVIFSTPGVTAGSAQAVCKLPPRQEPTLTATVGGAAGSGAVFTIEYAAVGNAFEVSSVGVSEGGSGYSNGSPINFQLGDDDTEDSQALAQIVTAIQQPSVTAEAPGGQGASLQVVLVQTFGGWYVSAVVVLAAGSGYTEGEPVSFSGAGAAGAAASISVNAAGEIIGVSVFSGGLYYEDTGIISSVELFSGGAYYKQPTGIESVLVSEGGRYYDESKTETNVPIDAPACIGSVDEWELKTYRLARSDFPSIPLDKSQTVTTAVQTGCWQPGLPSVLSDMERTRQCGYPTLSFEFQK